MLPENEAMHGKYVINVSDNQDEMDRSIRHWRLCYGTKEDHVVLQGCGGCRT